MALDIFIDESASDPSQALVAGFYSQAPAAPIVLAQGDTAKAVNLHWLSTNPDTADPTRPYLYNTPPATVSFAVGTVDAAVTGGTFTITEAAAAQTTGAITFGSSAATVQTAIRAACTTNLPACVVTGTGTPTDPYIVDRVTVGTLTDPTATGTSLTPNGSGVEIISYDGTATLSKKFAVILNRAPAVLATSWATNTPVPAALSTVTGGSAGVNEVQRLTVPNDIYGGTITLALTLASGPTAITASDLSTDATNSLITAADHGLATGDSIVIAVNNGSTPTIDGTHTVTKVTASTFTIPVNVTVVGTTTTFTVAAMLRDIGPLTAGISAEDFTTALEAHDSSKAIAGSFTVSKSVGSSTKYDITFKGSLGSTNITAMTITNDGLLYPTYLEGTLNCRTSGVVARLAGSLVPVTTYLEIQKTVSSNVTMSAFRDDVSLRPKLISQ